MEKTRWKSLGDVTSPIRSPTMAGGLFTTDRDFFLKVGAFDEDMDFWGVDNTEISLLVKL